MTLNSKLPKPTSTRWQLLRAGIQNVWEYDDQRFVFHKGRLLLRGQNESGKTKALEVLLPFLLDASLHPQRLDPFGSNARSMRWNLVNDANPEVNVSIGYVWLELGRLDEGAASYWTVGAGLKARRAATTVDDWYFATDRRVDDTLSLLDASRVPLTRPGLVAALGDRGTVFEGASLYRRALNERLFGLGTEQYSALVDALLQLRRPQLSKALDPAELSRILSASLPPLDAGIVGSLAEGFERLDRHRAEREECQTTLLSVRSFLEVYRHYVGTISKRRALEVTRADSAFHGARTKLKEAETKREAAQAAVLVLTSEIEGSENESVALDERLRVLRDSNEFRAISQLEEAERQAERQQAAAERARQARDEGQARAKRAQERVAEAQGVAREDAQTLVREKDSSQAAAAACALAEVHGALLQALDEGKPATARDALKASLSLRNEAVEGLRHLDRRLNDAVAALDTATARATQAEQRVRSAGEALDHAVAAERRAREEFLEGVGAWLGDCRELKVEAAGLLELPPEAMRGALEGPVTAQRDALDEDLRAASLALDTAARELKAVLDEHAALKAQRHRPPAAPAWRSPRQKGRPGAPLYLLCEFDERLDLAARAGLEAGLEAAGLLDAWVTPDGTLLDRETFDAVLLPGSLEAGADRPSLAEALRPVPGGDVSPDRVASLLRSIGLGEGSGAAWVSTDGRFALGPLHGNFSKPEAAFIGAAAREQARLKTLAELEQRIADLEVDVAACVEAVQAVRERRARLEAELRGFPDSGPLRDRQAASSARGEELGAARAAHAEEVERVQKADEARATAAQALDRRAAEAGLRGWVDRLDDLVRQTASYGAAAHTLLKTDEGARRSAAEAADRGRELTKNEAEASRAVATAQDAQREATEARARAEALRESVGKTREDLLTALRVSERRQGEVRTELKARRQLLAERQSDAGALTGAVNAAAEKVAECDEVRRAAEGSFRIAESRQLFAIIGVQGSGPAQEWTYTDVLLTARKVDEATVKVDPSDAARDKAWNRVSERHQELMRSLRPELRVIASQLDGVTVYEAIFNARRLSLLELKAELEGDLAARDRLLAEEERKLFESFLTGEAHEHLREQLREASGLVKRMNRQLQAHPTSSGMQMRLVWDVAEEAPPGTREGVALLFKSGELLSDADRDALLGFLRQRLDEARTHAEARTLQDQLLSVLDYRAWHTFEVQCRSGAEPWKRLTKKVHGTGSGGQKAVMLHLPLFAAAAAFYDSARVGAPRFILLDEAFAGIDRQTRGELMGLLSDFDLDFVMTSFEEWGFYPQVDGLSTYHLAREKGMRGVYSEWFVWDGREAVQMQA